MSNPISSEYIFDIEYEQGTIVNWEFEFDNLDELHYIHTGCYCTQLTSIDGNKLIGTLAIDSAMSNELKTKEGEHIVEKHLSVYLDQNVPEFIVGDLSKRIFNPLKKVVNLIIRGTVRVKESS